MTAHPDVRHMLDLSTHHLPEELGSSGLSGEEGVVAYELPHGWLMWVPEDPDKHAADYGTVPEVVLVVQRYARKLGCEYVLFDQDADRINELPTWDW